MRFDSFSSAPWSVTLGLWAMRIFAIYLIFMALLAAVQGRSKRLFFSRPTRESIDQGKDNRSFLSWRYEQTGDLVSRSENPQKFWAVVLFQIASGFFILLLF